jgi:hypothetical protein
MTQISGAAAQPELILLLACARTRHGEAEALLQHSQHFAEALSWLVTNKLHGPVPRALSRMKRMAWEGAAFSYQELHEQMPKTVRVSECLEDCDADFVWHRFVHRQRAMTQAELEHFQDD